MSEQMYPNDRIRLVLATFIKAARSCPPQFESSTLFQALQEGQLVLRRLDNAYAEMEYLDGLYRETTGEYENGHCDITDAQRVGRDAHQAREHYQALKTEFAQSLINLSTQLLSASTETKRQSWYAARDFHTALRKTAAALATGWTNWSRI